MQFGKLIIAAKTSLIKNAENCGKIGLACDTMKLAVCTIGIYFIVSISFNTFTAYYRKKVRKIKVRKNCDVLRNLVSIVQFKKLEKHPSGSVTFLKNLKITHLGVLQAFSLQLY